MAETDPTKLVCSCCGHLGLYGDDDGHFYCTNCNSQAEDIVDRGNADEDFVDKDNNRGTAVYSTAHKRRVDITVDAEPHCLDHVGPTEPADFGTHPKGIFFSEEDYYNSLRMRYVLGVQLMVQLQCEVLVEKFGVSPLICGISGSIWFRFVASSKVFDDDWADQTVLESEKGEKRYQVGKDFPNEPRNMHNERMVIIWCRSLKKAIPLSSSLAVSYLACHIAKEPVLPNDITKWAIEGKLPYFGVYPKIAESIKKIEKRYQHVSIVCPVKASSMFKPSELHLQKLESMAASIAQAVGLSLPPVNFYGIACRYLKQLSLPIEKIIPYACRIQEWAMPPNLWLSANEAKFPTRVCVMSILIVAIRILYNLNGFGKWETTLSASTDFSSTDDDKSNVKKETESVSKRLGGESKASMLSVHKLESDSAEVLRNLEKRYDDLSNTFEYFKDLPTYLQYCKDVVFAGLEPLYKDPTFIEELWEFYEKNREDLKTSQDCKSGSNQKRSRDDYQLFSTPIDSKKHKEEDFTSSFSPDSTFQFYKYITPKPDPDADFTPQSSESHQGPSTADKGESSSQVLEDTALKYLKIDMEEHRFCYIPPRVDIKRYDYLHYVRKKGDSSLAFVAHADYYILLRACAKVAQVDFRVMHVAVLSLERRLSWIEKWIDRSLLGKCSNDKPVDYGNGLNDDGPVDYGDDLDDDGPAGHGDELDDDGPVGHGDDLDDEFVNLSNLNI